MEPRVQKRERDFGLSVGTVCALLAAYGWWRGAPAPASADGGPGALAPWILAGVAVWLIGFALVQPSLLAIPSALWWRLAHMLGWVNSRVLLSALYFGILTPVGLLKRAGGWDPLRLKRTRASGWVAYPSRDPKHYERMF